MCVGHATCTVSKDIHRKLRYILILAHLYSTLLNQNHCLFHPNSEKRSCVSVIVEFTYVNGCIHHKNYTDNHLC